MVHCTRSAVYGCTRQGLTRFTTSLCVGPLPAPRRGPGGRGRDRPARVSLPLALRPGGRLVGVDRDLPDHRRLQGAAAAVRVLLADDDRLVMYFTDQVQ